MPVFLLCVAVAFTLMLLVLAWVDCRTGMLPDVLTLALLWAGLLVNLDGLIVPLREAVIGAAGAYLFLRAVNAIHRTVVGHDGMGFGDFKLAAALGAWFGPALLVWVLLGACVAGGCVLLARRFFAGRIHGPLPFGPCLSVAGIAAMATVFIR